MYIAVCDDNIADRRQLERLIKKTSDQFKQGGEPLLADYFGSSETFLANPLQYDAFYIDMCRTPGVDVKELVSVLWEKGVRVPIVLCCSRFDYRTLGLQGEVLYLDKPIRQEDLNFTLDCALETKRNKAPVIEFRDEYETYYVEEPQIMYVIQENPFLYVHLTDKRVIRTVGNVMNLFDELERFPSFMASSITEIINCRYVKSIKFRKATMTDGNTFKIARECLGYAKKYSQIYAKEQA